MSALLPARAPITSSSARSTPLHRRAARLGIAAVVVAAGLGWPVPSESASMIAGPHGTTSNRAAMPVAELPHESEADPRRAPPTVPGSQPLAPAPPPDRRDAPDPFILHDNGRYLLYSTQVGLHNVPVTTSPDLRHWSPPADALPQLPAWAAWGRTWAPGVTQLADRYLLYFAAHHQSSGRQCTGVATSADADGPFVAQPTGPIVCQTRLGGSIDPHPFIDADGTPFLVWKADGNAIGLPSTLFGQRLRPDGLALADQPVPLVSSDAPWEQPLIENPALVAAGRSYVLLYSGGWWESAGYAVGYATCDTPLGPCTKITVDRPLLASASDQAGPGGACVITGPARDQWLAYHAWTPGAIGYDNGGTRSLRFASLTWPNGQPAISR